MANPNIVNVATINGNTSSIRITSSSNPHAVAIANNPAGSNKIYKINSILVSNVDGTNAADISLNIFSQDDFGGTGNAIVSTISVPADATLIVIDKATAFYLLEDKSIGATSNPANVLVVTASWDEIS